MVLRIFILYDSRAIDGDEFAVLSLCRRHFAQDLLDPHLEVLALIWGRYFSFTLIDWKLLVRSDPCQGCSRPFGWWRDENLVTLLDFPSLRFDRRLRLDRLRRPAL